MTTEAGGRQGKRKAFGNREGAGSTQSKVHTSDGVSLEMKKKMGIFWPIEIYEAIEKKKLAVKDQVTMNDGFKNIKGVIRPSSEGCPDGCIEVTQNRTARAELSNKIYDTDTAIRDGIGETFWQQARDQLACKRKSTGSAA